MRPNQLELSNSAQHLLVLAKQVAGDKPVDANTLLLAFLQRHMQMLERLATGIDVKQLQKEVEEETQTDSNRRTSIEEVIQLANQVAQSESSPVVDVRHIGIALLSLRGVDIKAAPPLFPPNVPQSQVSILQAGINLNMLAQEGQLPVVVARDEEINTLIETLCRPINPYAILMGIEGVGRRAVVQGLTQRIVSGQVPDILKDRVVIMFPQLFDDPNFYFALADEAARANAILYIEPFEGLISTPIPQLEMLRMQFLNELVNRRVPVIGAVSSMEQFRKQVGHAPDLLKRFQAIPVVPLSAEESLLVLEQLATHMRETQQIDFPPETLKQIVRVADETIQHRPFPDKAILLFDQAAGRARAQGKSVVDTKTIWEIASLVTGLPIGAGEISLMERLAGLETYLKSRVIGQEDAIGLLVKVFSLKIRRLDIRPERPNGVFMFVGPTGVGKTETARALAEYFFGSSQRMLRLDMNQFYSEHTLARLLGAEYGYIGFEKGSPLLDFVAENPFSVVLLDEMEKADQEIHKFFLQLFDDGYIVDAQGRRVSFSDTIVIMTSNLRPDEEVGFLRGGPALSDWQRTFRDRFSPEFMNRVDAVCVFKPLTKEDIGKIIRERIHPRLNEVYSRRGVSLELTNAAVNWLVEKGFNEHYGARELERVVERELLMLVAPHVPLQIEEAVLHPLRVDVQGDKLGIIT
jgi:ATP-dependent Clp protease ATP-binding subunit ClpC